MTLVSTPPIPGPLYYVTGLGDGSDESTLINAAIAQCSTTGGTVQLTKPLYGIGASLDGSQTNVRLIGMPGGGTTLRKLNSAGTASILLASGAATMYNGYQFENLTFDGGSPQAQPGITLSLTNLDRVTFTRCDFRRLNTNASAQGMRNVQYIECRFFGTVAGVMQSGVQSTTPVPTAAYTYGSGIGSGCVNVQYDRCLFHFLPDGMTGSASTTAHAHGLSIRNCRFRGDWWNTPYKTLEFTPTAYNTSTRVLTVAGGGFTGFFGNFQVCSVPIQIATGSALTRAYGGQVQTAGSFVSPQVGDVIETADGRRAEIQSVVSSTNVWVKAWESIDTFEPTDAPALATAWTLTRYYAASASFTSDTTITLTSEPVCPFNGQRLVTDAALTPVGILCRTFAKLTYSGIHINGGQDTLLVLGNRFRGSWADQCSIFDSEAPQVIGNTFEYGQDEGITNTRCPRSVLHGNTFHYGGTSAIFLDHAVGASVSSNTINAWGLTNFNIRGAIEGNGLNMSIIGNTFSVPASGTGGQSGSGIGLYTSSSAGTIIAGNVDGGCRTSTLYIETAAGSVTARDLVSKSGTGANSVLVPLSYDGTATLLSGQVPTYNGTNFAPATPASAPVANANQVIAGPTSGGAATATGRALVANDLPSIFNVLGMRAANAVAAGIYIPWISGDTLPSLYVGASNASNNQIAVNAQSNTIALQGVSLASVGVFAQTGVTGTGAIKGVVNASATNTASTAMILAQRTSGTPAAGFGVGVNLVANSTTTLDVLQAQLVSSWIDPTHASRTPRLTLSVQDSAGGREGFRVESDGTQPKVSVNGATAIARATATAAATDAASTQTLANALRTLMISFGLWS